MNTHRYIFTSLLALLIYNRAVSQCPEVYDFYGISTDTPYWYSCSGDDYMLNLQSVDNWGAYTIDWGDGTPQTNGASWISPGFIQHLYTAAVDTFSLVLTETTSGCQINGVLVMEEATSASIQIPVGGLTQACAPQMMEFINSSTNVSETTVFTWDFGDGSAPLVFDYTNWLQTIQHTYEVGTVDCETEVSLTAENYCNIIQGGESEATFNPIRIWDLDDPGIGASATLLCYPDTVVTFTNTTERNCYFQGNIYQRYEYWNFGDVWGLGYDSIIDWTPWPPTFPHTIAFPGIGSYTIEMLDSNFCGIAPTAITIQIVAPPVAGIDASEDTVCVGQPITFYQLGSGNANHYEWNFGTNIGWINTGSGNITYTYNNPGTYYVQNEVSITGSSSACNDIAGMQVVVLPNPLIQIVPDVVQGCDSLTVNYSQNSSGAQVYDWTFDVAPFSYSGAIPPAIYYSTPGNHDVSIHVIGSNGCESSDEEEIHVYSSPAASFAVMNLCEGDTATFLDNSQTQSWDPVISWDWDFGDGAVSNSTDPDHFYTTTGSFTASLEVATAHCSDTTSMTLTVEAAPVVNVSQDIFSGCSPVPVQFANNTLNAVSYSWSFGDGQFSTGSAPAHSYANLTNQDTTYEVVVHAYNAFGCGSMDTLYVTVYPYAVAAFDDGDVPPGCAPLLLTFNNNSVNAEMYSWNFSDGTTSTQFEPTHTFFNTTGFIQTFPVTLQAIDIHGCSDTIVHNVIVYPTPDFSFVLPADSGCAPMLVAMPFIGGVQQFLWNFGDGTTSSFPMPNHLFNNNSSGPITYTIGLTGTNAFGCVDTATATLVVNPPPVSQFVTDVISGCSPLGVQFTNLSLHADTYNWDYGDGTTSTESDVVHQHLFTNNTGNVQVFQIELDAMTDDGCMNTFIQSVEVYPQVSASFISPGSQCSPASVYYNNTSSNAQYYDWDFGNGLQSQAQNGTSYYTNNTDSTQVFDVTLMAVSPYGCQSNITQQLIVNPTPDASFTISESALCEPAPVLITNNSTLATQFQWNYGDGQSSTITDPQHVHVFQDPSSGLEEYTILLTASTLEGCMDTTSAVFTLYPDVVAAFTADTVDCSPFPVMFVNQSIAATSFEWAFGDGLYSSQISPVHVFTTDNTSDSAYLTTLIAENGYGCVDTTSLTIHVNHTPEAIAQVDSLYGCYPMNVVFANQSIGGDTYQWVYGTGQTSTTSDSLHTYTYYNYTDFPVTYNVTLNVNTVNGCHDADQLSVDVMPELHADFNIDPEGCTPLEVSIDNNSDGAFSYLWDFGDGDFSNEEEPTHTFFNWGTTDTTYFVQLIIQNLYGCTDTADATITIFPQPVASFLVDPTSQVWPNSTIILDNTTIGGSLTYHWEMDDNTEFYVEEPGTYTYSTWGEYNIELFVTNGSCDDMVVQTIEILPPPPVANFTGPAEGCAPLTVQFTNLSEYALSSYWQFGDGGAANSTNPVYTYWQPGTYTVTLMIQGYGSNSSDVMVQENIIHVYPSAIAIFTVTPTEVNVPSQPVYCLNLSQNAETYEWQFGDGSTSNQENPIYFYQDAGIYGITLIANNEYNCPDTMTIVDAVHATAVGMLDFPNAFTPNTQGGGGGAYDAMSFDNDVFFPIHRGVEEYNLQIFNKWGELLYESKDVLRGWDGYYRSQLCKQDVYVWKVRARFVDGEEIVKSGDVTLLVR